MCFVVVAPAWVAAAILWQMLPQKPAAIRGNGRAPTAPLLKASAGATRGPSTRFMATGHLGMGCMVGG